VTIETFRDAPTGVQTLPEAGRKHFAIDGVEPRLTGAPATAEEAARLLGWASEQRLAVGTRGGGTRSALGNVPRALDLVLSTEKLGGVREYEPADLTITVGAGTPFEELQRVLGEKGQFLSLDPAVGKGSTIGGVVAANASGPLRLRYGTLRDLLIGTQVATPVGTVARSGGKVVKNVTGYDLNKLYVGSLGTLGVLTELTFKVQPKPESERSLVARFPDVGSACRSVYRVLRSPITPSAMELTRAVVNGVPAVVLHVHLGGFAKPLERSVGDLERFARDEGALDVEPLEGEAIWRSLADGPSPSVKDGTRLKIAVPIGQVAWAFGQIEDAVAAAGLEASVQASAGVGVLRVVVQGGDAAALVTIVRRLRAAVREHLGSVVVESCPLPAKEGLDVLGEVPDNFEIMRRLKSQLDPAGIMNPGRFLGRL
jgi:glycolate oxidase FAD binding subunit